MAQAALQGGRRGTGHAAGQRTRRCLFGKKAAQSGVLSEAKRITDQNSVIGLPLLDKGKKGEQAGQAVPGLTCDILRNQTRTIRAGFKEFGSRGWTAATRGELSYKDYDTYALGVALSDATKQPANAYGALGALLTQWTSWRPTIRIASEAASSTPRAVASW